MINETFEDLMVEYSASVLAPWDDFSTSMTNFPGLNAQAPWGDHGDFHVSFKLYSEGKKIGELSSKNYTEKDVITLELDDLLRHVRCSAFECASG